MGVWQRWGLSGRAAEHVSEFLKRQHMPLVGRQQIEDLSQQGSVVAQAISLAMGWGKAKSPTEARELLESSDDPMAYYVLAKSYGGHRPNLGLTMDRAREVEFMKKAADGGVAAAQYELAIMIEQGLSDAKKTGQNASDLLASAAKAGFAPARLLQSEEKAPSAAATAAAAATAIGAVIASPSSIAQRAQYARQAGNNEVALELYREAASEGSSDAQYRLGVFHEEGMLGLDQDFNEAHKWYSMAVKNVSLPHPGALYRLGRLYSQGLGVVKDPEKAEFLYSQIPAIADNWVYLFSDAVEDGKAVMDLAQLLETVRFKDADRAVVLLLRCAQEHGSEKAEAQLDSVTQRLTAEAQLGMFVQADGFVKNVPALNAKAELQRAMRLNEGDVHVWQRLVSLHSAGAANA